ncbi:hypothetical protein B0H15DRAFT_1023295 [Mycena belliarum]|uniref:Uncharacterized protein n=1 Tax=Mycena belliarum TaxID=1033014 RepID=A0AAD6U0N0_9AGAR|nr:hypothetical protein B0H15DRAFT_1023295 [Mycena belliae]
MALSESSTSTTDTKTYMLEKYSRAYAPKTESGSSEWQHFTNPVLRLFLDIKCSPQKAESFRLRIVWTMNGGPDSAQQDVTLEDLDLLAFSSIRDDESDSSPLKGVYRDTTFGLRYLHVSNSSEAPKVHRKFQVSFTTAASTLQFVEAIRDVCPCKSTEPNAQPRKNTAAIPTASRRLPQASLPPWQKSTSHLSSSVAPAPSQTQRPPTMITPDVPVMLSSSPPLALSSQPDPNLLTPFSSSPYGADGAAPPQYRPWCIPSMSPAQALASAPASQPTAPTIMTANKPLPKPASFPESSPPSSSADSVMMPPPPPPPASADALLTALRDATGLYDLPHSALERLVGDVVREDKFVQLLDSMSSMWAMKALLQV